MTTDNKKTLTPKQARWLPRFCWVFVIFSILTTLFFGLNSLRLRYQPEQPAIKAARIFKDPLKVTKHVRVNGVDYDIPVSYFNTMVPGWTEGFKIYLIFMWPDLAPLQKSEAQLAKEGRLDESFTDLADDPRFVITLEQQLEFTLGQNKKSTMTGHRYGLEAYEPNDHGGSAKDAYVLRKNGRVVTFIRCTEDYVRGMKPPMNPQCQHFYNDGYLIHKILYTKKKYLSSWREVEDKARTLYASFRAGALSKGLDKVTIPSERVDPRIKTRQPIRKEK